MRRILVIVTALTLGALALPAEAKAFTYTDPKDMPADAGLDIVGVRYATEGTTSTRKVGRRTVKKYEPTKLVVTMTMAGPVFNQPGVKYHLHAQAEGCGEMKFIYTPAAGKDVLTYSQFSLACGGAPGALGGTTLFFAPQFAIKGNSLVWAVPLKALPKNVRAGALLYGFKSSVDITDPAIGALGPEDFGDGVLDKAKTDADWEIS
ncbi:MAG TPA: hypothetical protein VNA14_11925 [Mycobacteriales bacterium]|nr:hypothetical protein [Mycobacteriales bacterium]